MQSAYANSTIKNANSAYENKSIELLNSVIRQTVQNVEWRYYDSGPLLAKLEKSGEEQMKSMLK